MHQPLRGLGKEAEQEEANKDKTDHSKIEVLEVDNRRKEDASEVANIEEDNWIGAERST